jgi:hypothetical protein
MTAEEENPETQGGIKDTRGLWVQDPGVLIQVLSVPRSPGHNEDHMIAWLIIY